MAKPLSKRREAKLRAAFRIMGRAFVELLLQGEQGERGTTDWQAAVDMAERLERHLSHADWERFVGVDSRVADELGGRFFAEPVRRKRPGASDKKPALH